ncbi:MAG: short-chain dehydrogenase/reductase [Proteobacteria bacterium]|nr:short-chain dehydrogenase/reductase [Pseudomonadota bacterium]
MLGFLPAPYMALYWASKHAVEGLSETLDHEARRTVARIPDYDKELGVVSRAIQNNVQKVPLPDGVAATIVDAALGPWKMRYTPKGEASLLAKLRRFMPADPVEKGLRKTFGLA